MVLFVYYYCKIACNYHDVYSVCSLPRQFAKMWPNILNRQLFLEMCHETIPYFRILNSTDQYSKKNILFFPDRPTLDFVLDGP